MTQDVIVKEQVKYDILASVEFGDVLAYLERYEIDMSEDCVGLLSRVVVRNAGRVLYQKHQFGIESAKSDHALWWYWWFKGGMRDLFAPLQPLPATPDDETERTVLIALARLYAEVLANMDDIPQTENRKEE